MKQAWAPTQVRYLDSATYGIPPTEAVNELLAVTQSWAVGEYDPLECDHAIARARAAYARLHSVRPSDVAIGHQVAPCVAAFAAAIGRPGKVLTVENDFTSLLFPFVAAGREVVSVPLHDLPNAIDADTAAVAVSAVQSADGHVADLESLSAAAAGTGAYTLIDATQASGWLPLDASRFDAVVTGGYKWLCHPRGTAFMTVGERLSNAVPLTANWYAGENPWETCYGLPLRLASDARKFDVSPAWLNWHAAAVALERIEQTGVKQIYEHNLALAGRVRAALGLDPMESAIVACDVASGASKRLREAGIKTSERANRLRISCHLYNDDNDIDELLEVLVGATVAGRI